MNKTSEKKEIDCKSVVYNEEGNKFNRCELDVPFVPTPYSVINEMLSIAKTTPSDIVFDLGCGDGRIVIAAAKDFDAFATGFDIDSHRISECLINAQKAGISKKVSFLNKNFFDISLSEASVITMYLLTNINVRLRQKMFDELKPGSRVISHDFHMDSWMADFRSTFEGHTLYLWIIPANFSGKWSWQMPECYGADFCTLEISQHFQKATLSFQHPDIYTPESILIKGNLVEIRFHSNIKSREKFFLLRGAIENNSIKGMIIQTGKPISDWCAQRNPSTVKDISS